jgi:hypothetical protein
MVAILGIPYVGLLVQRGWGLDVSLLSDWASYFPLESAGRLDNEALQSHIQ